MNSFNHKDEKKTNQKVYKYLWSFDKNELTTESKESPKFIFKSEDWPIITQSNLLKVKNVFGQISDNECNQSSTVKNSYYFAAISSMVSKTGNIAGIINSGQNYEDLLKKHFWLFEKKKNHGEAIAILQTMVHSQNCKYKTLGRTTQFNFHKNKRNFDLSCVLFQNKYNKFSLLNKFKKIMNHYQLIFSSKAKDAFVHKQIREVAWPISLVLSTNIGPEYKPQRVTSLFLGFAYWFCYNLSICKPFIKMLESMVNPHVSVIIQEQQKTTYVQRWNVSVIMYHLVCAILHYIQKNTNWKIMDNVQVACMQNYTPYYLEKETIIVKSEGVNAHFKYWENCYMCKKYDLKRMSELILGEMNDGLENWLKWFKNNEYMPLAYVLTNIKANNLSNVWMANVINAHSSFDIKRYFNPKIKTIIVKKENDKSVDKEK